MTGYPRPHHGQRQTDKAVQPRPATNLPTPPTPSAQTGDESLTEIRIHASTDLSDLHVKDWLAVQSLHRNGDEIGLLRLVRDIHRRALLAPATNETAKDHRLVGEIGHQKCTCGWEPPLGRSVWGTFDQHLLDVWLATTTQTTTVPADGPAAAALTVVKRACDTECKSPGTHHQCSSHEPYRALLDEFGDVL